jgi:hypothetical protein
MHVRLRPALLAAVLSSCAAPEAKHPNPTHPIAEGRAIAIIARAFQDNGTPAAEGRDIRLANGTSIHMDVAAAGQTFDASLSAQAKLRSKHNTFMAVPVVFIMISNHFPVATYGSTYNWEVLVALVLLGWAAAKVIRES